MPVNFFCQPVVTSRAPCWMDSFKKSYNARYMGTSHGSSRINAEVNGLREGRTRGPGCQNINTRSSNIRLQPHSNTYQLQKSKN
jgi:protein subunit release factor B